MDCEFCKKQFSTITNLTFHQKTAKYCLTIQGKTNDQYKCTYCEKCFTTNQQLDKHDKICKTKQNSNYNQELVKIKEDFLAYKKQEKTLLKDQKSYFEKKIQEKEERYESMVKEKESYYSTLIKKTKNITMQC